MIHKIITFICLTFIFGCNQPKDNTSTTFIVPTDSMLLPKSIGNDPPPPPPVKEYYLPSNFIIDTGGHVYYYQQKLRAGRFCGTGMDWDMPPSFINLQPKDIIEVPTQNLENFIKLNIQYINNPDGHIAIASVADTITSPGLAKIFSVLKDTSNHIAWTFRKTTQEENVVLNFKKSGEHYYSEDIKWDSLKTLFPPKIDRNLFIPPKIK